MNVLRFLLFHYIINCYLFIYYDEFDIYFYDQMKSKINHNPLQSQVFDVSIALENSLEPIVCSSVERCDYVSVLDSYVVQIVYNVIDFVFVFLLIHLRVNRTAIVL